MPLFSKYFVATQISFYCWFSIALYQILPCLCSLQTITVAICSHVIPSYPVCIGLWDYFWKNNLKLSHKNNRKLSQVNAQCELGLMGHCSLAEKNRQRPEKRLFSKFSFLLHIYLSRRNIFVFTKISYFSRLEKPWGKNKMLIFG